MRGALTAGEPIVQQAHPIGGKELDSVLALAAAAERAADDHPVARAIQRYADEHGHAAAAVRKERVHAGLGVTAVTSHGVPVVVGRRQLLLDEGISVATADSDATHIESEGLTPIFIAIDGRLEALVAILDPVHVGARDAVQRITDLPCDVVILSGDDRRTVERIAAQLGAPRVKAPLLPHERVTEVRALRETGGITATIGRGGRRRRGAGRGRCPDLPSASRLGSGGARRGGRESRRSRRRRRTLDRPSGPAGNVARHRLLCPSHGDHRARRCIRLDDARHRCAMGPCDRGVGPSCWLPPASPCRSPGADAAIAEKER
ncbi:MAG: cation-translocating P-type ATPase [Deltaproteobacteria bacterium]|nr:cation-translocating P-type ATPase [Deltaproteobacteria bacterium]